MELGNQIQIASSSGSTDVVSISSLIGLQTRSNFYHVKDGLISLLRNCLELEARHNSSVTILSGYVDHFQSLPSVDVGWGCGWRNIQMLSSHLLAHRKEARKVLIGTTECASLFRSFGLRARVVDFGPKESELLYLSVPGSTLGQPVKQRNAVRVSGPMDKYVHRQQGLNKGRHFCHSLHNGKSDNSKGKSEGPQGTVALERSLKTTVGWQKLIKRGVHTLKKPQYQLCYIDPGIASGEELNELKTINSIFFEL
ncbi:Meiotically up-regulated protein [Gossypium arboreum]|uniref:Meiotically up-regulated protein n=1 Tax=Gossypium arboreum TaxID=29729 RepID=A0A0B0PD76_GOSAR|nr:Meiotically up-regulated protein [Gossypium arboreum]